MSISEIAALLWRHKIVTAVVLVFALTIAVYIKRTPPMYQENVTVVFIGPLKSPNPYAAFTGDLVATGYVVMQELTSQESEDQISKAGGSAAYAVGLVNGYNLQYPVYGKPYATLTSMSRNPAAVQRTVAVVSQQLDRILASRQANVAEGARVVAHFIGDSGLTVVPGSSKRVYAGELMLSIIALLMVVGLVDRLPGRLTLVTRVRRFASGK